MAKHYCKRVSDGKKYGPFTQTCATVANNLVEISQVEFMGGTLPTAPSIPPNVIPAPPVVTTQPVVYTSPGTNLPQTDAGQVVPAVDLGTVFGGVAGGVIGGAAGSVIGAGLSDYLPGLPGGEYSFGDILPGGAPFSFPDLPSNRIVKHWWTGTALFARDATGKHWVRKKDGTWKSYKPGGAIVIGKELTIKNLNRGLRVMNRYRKLGKAVDKVFPKRRSIRRSCK